MRFLAVDVELFALAAAGAFGVLAPGSAPAAAAAHVLDTATPLLDALVARRFKRVVYLGSGGLQGLAREATLKLGELTNGAVVTCFDSPLGFRHGPKTFVTANTLVVVFVSGDTHTRRYDHDLIDELRRDGLAACVLEVTAHPRDTQSPDTLVVPGLRNAPDIDLVWPYVAAAQLYAFFQSLARGVTPDNPNPAGVVNRVVQGVQLYALDA